MSNHYHFEWLNRQVSILTSGFLALVFVGPVVYAANVSGIINDASGQPVAGALVKIKSADSRILFMVVSQEGGRYTTPELPAGEYFAQGFGGGLQSQPSRPVEVNNRSQIINLSMNMPQTQYPPPKKDYTEEEFAGMMPADEGKDVILAKCTICHSAGNFVSRRKTPTDWHDTVVKMRYRWEQMPMLVDAFKAATGNSIQPISDAEIEVMADYFARHFNLDIPPLYGTPHPDSHLPRTLLKGDEASYVVMEMNLGAALVGSYDIDPQGIIWASEKTSGILGRLDPETLSYKRIHIPPVNVTEEFYGGVAVDPQGMVWFSSNVVPDAQWFQYDPDNNEIINTYDIPLPTRPGGDIYFNSFAFPENGSIWSVVTAFHKVYKLDPVTRTIKEFLMREGQHPFGMTIAGDGNIWYAGDNDSILVKIDPDTDELTPYKLNPKTGPRRLATDQDGNIWAAAIDRSALVKMDYRTGEVKEFTPPSAHTIQGLPIVEKYLQGVDVDKTRNLIWFSEYEAIKLARFDPATNSFLEFSLATAESQPWIVKIDPTNSNRVWWNSRNGRIGYLELMD